MYQFRPTCKDPGHDFLQTTKSAGSVLAVAKITYVCGGYVFGSLFRCFVKFSHDA